MWFFTPQSLHWIRIVNLPPPQHRKVGVLCQTQQHPDESASLCLVEVNALTSGRFAAAWMSSWQDGPVLAFKRIPIPNQHMCMYIYICRVVYMIFTYIISIYLYPCERLCTMWGQSDRLEQMAHCTSDVHVSDVLHASCTACCNLPMSPSVPPLSAVCPLNTVDYSSEFIVLSL